MVTNVLVYKPYRYIQNILGGNTIVICERWMCWYNDLETKIIISKPEFDCSKSTMQTLEQGVKYVQN